MRVKNLSTQPYIGHETSSMVIEPVNKTVDDQLQNVDTGCTIISGPSSDFVQQWLQPAHTDTAGPSTHTGPLFEDQSHCMCVDQGSVFTMHIPKPFMNSSLKWVKYQKNFLKQLLTVQK